MKPRAIVLIGPPASGKGTHGKVLGMLPGFLHFSMGHAFRSRVPKDDAERTLLEGMFQQTSKGELVPDEIALRLFQESLHGLMGAGQFQPSSQLLVLDGIPRTGVQARAMVDLVDIERVFEFTCTDEEIFRRIRGRALKEGRADDASEDIVRTRLEVYRRALPELIIPFEAQLVRLDTNRPAHHVLRELLEHL
jgi:adenylate kinase